MEVVRGARATNFEPEKQVQFAFLSLPDSPIEPMGGMARIAGNEARAPRLEVKNRSDRAIRYLEVGWILHDRSGREFLAGSVPAELNLAPGTEEPDPGRCYAKISATWRAAAGYRRYDWIREQRRVRRWHGLDSHS